ncbi:MAG: hypothetical protein KAV99_00245 [Candidatus Latescibacteria bacterium]|nr:hypothetical protein [Candidatus Latescibacterota bacterium]
MFGSRKSILGVSIGCLALVVMVFFGCADFSDVTGPTDTAVEQAKHEQPSIAPPAGLNWLQYTPTEGLAKTIIIKGDTNVEGLFEPGKDLTLALGKLSTISMKLEIDGNALKKETLISMALPEPGTVMMDLGAVFAPSGLKFRKPVKWTVESKTITVDPKDVENLQCYHWNEKNKKWKLIGGEVKLVGNKLILICWIDGFSRYAWA